MNNKNISVITSIYFLLAACATNEVSQNVNVNDSKHIPPKYPLSKENFVERFKHTGNRLVCNIKESRDCLGFTSNCSEEFNDNVDFCMSNAGSKFPDTIYSKATSKPLFTGLLKCVTDRQLHNSKGQISMEACMALEKMRKNK